MSQRAAIRRRKQAAMGYKHLPPLRRPHYVGYDTASKSRKGRLQLGLKKK